MRYIDALKNYVTRRQTMMLVAVLVVLGTFMLPGGLIRSIKAQNTAAQTTVVLVHGTFADGSSWRKIIPLLQARGLQTIAVQNPLTSLADDVAATKRAIESAPGPVILVGHSWGGSIITQAGNNQKVKALVYIAAFAPSKNQSVNDLYKDYPHPEWFGKAIMDPGGFVTLPPDAVRNFFAQDLPDSETSLIAATQGPVLVTAFDDKITETAWNTKPTWYIVAAEDRMISPDIERAAAQKIGAKTTVLQSSHVPMLSKPKEVADVILAAAGGLSVKQTSADRAKKSRNSSGRF